jgi:hypothetical protein
MEAFIVDCSSVNLYDVLCLGRKEGRTEGRKRGQGESELNEWRGREREEEGVRVCVCVWVCVLKEERKREHVLFDSGFTICHVPRE